MREERGENYAGETIQGKGKKKKKKKKSGRERKGMWGREKRGGVVVWREEEV